MDEVLQTSNMSGGVLMTWPAQVFLCFPLMPAIILLVGQRSINHNEMFQREVCKQCVCVCMRPYMQLCCVKAVRGDVQDDCVRLF